MGEMAYLGAEAYLRDIWRLAEQVRASGWRPDVMLALWRGGAPVGAALHEYLNFHGWTFEHYPVRCSSYSGVGENAGGVRFVKCDEVFAGLGPGQRVLVVDDVFDTGLTLQAVFARLASLGVESRSAVVYWKPGKNRTALRPDYCLRELDNRWLCFPHEMVGLSRAQVLAKDAELAEVLP